MRLNCHISEHNCNENYHHLLDVKFREQVYYFVSDVRSQMIPMWFDVSVIFLGTKCLLTPQDTNCIVTRFRLPLWTFYVLVLCGADRDRGGDLLPLYLEWDRGRHDILGILL